MPENSHVLVPLPTAAYAPEFHMESDELKIRIINERDQANFERQLQLKNVERQVKETYVLSKLDNKAP